VLVTAGQQALTNVRRTLDQLLHRT